MNPGEYDLMARVESKHWWYQGVRELFASILRMPSFKPQLNGRVLDAGCGTGQNLVLLQSLLQPSYLGGFDLAEQAVQYAASRLPRADIYQSDLRCPVLHSTALDLILCSDVLYTTGVQAALPGLRTLIDQLRSGGLFLLHLPALNWLYSRHDVAVHTVHRFRKSEVSSLLRHLGLKCELLTYRMFLLFPAVVFRRLPSLMFGVKDQSITTRSDLGMPHPVLNSLFRTIVRAENAAIGLGVRFPIGSSLIAVGRKL